MAIGEAHLFVAASSGFKDPGTVHVYARSMGGWEQTHQLQAAEPAVSDFFGRALAHQGNTLVVAGNAVVAFFAFDGSAWTRVTQLEMRIASVATDGRLALLGVPGADDTPGQVVVYEDGDGGWTEVARLAGEASAFGRSLAIDGQMALIGGEESVAFYRWDGQTLVQEATFAGSELSIEQSFGAAVSLSGSHALVGAPSEESVQAFRHEDGAWQPAGRLSPGEDVRGAGFFGTAVVAQADTWWVGAPFANQAAGAMYLFAAGDTVATGALAPEAAVGSGFLRFGSAAAVTNGHALIGMPGAAYGEGSAMLYAIEDGAWSFMEELFVEAEPMDPVLGEGEVCDQNDAGGYECGQVDLVSFLPLSDMGTARGVRLSDVWGWTDPETDREYGLVGHLEGTAFVDLGDPSRPRFLGELPRTEGSPGSTWRDIKVFADHAFIVADGAGAHGMQVFDLTRLRTLDDAPTIFEPDVLYDGIHSAHNIVVNEETGFAFAVGASGGGQTCGGGLHMIDVQNPQEPVFAGCFADESTGRRKTGYSHDAQCVIYQGPDSEHHGKEICVGSNETAISIADITDKDNPVAISSGTYPDAAYVHQGWLSEDHTFFYQNDELDELSGRAERTRTLVWDVSDLDDPLLVHEYFGPTSATDHNLYVHGDLMYQTNNASGLRILDISERSAPMEVGFFDTTPYGTNDAGFNGTWSSYPYFKSGIIMVTSRREGLFVLKKQTVGS